MRESLRETALWLLVVAGGSGAGVAVAYPPFWFLAFFAFIPVLFFIDDAQRSGSRYVFVRLLCAGWLFGGMVMGVVLWWMVQSPPAVFVGFPHQIIAATTVWFLTSMLLGLPIAIFVAVAYQVHVRSIRAFVVYPLVFVLAETLRSYLFSIYATGYPYTFAQDVPFGFLGYAIASTGFVWAASVGSVYVLSFIVIVMNVVIFHVLHGGLSNYIRKSAILGGLLLVISLVMWAPPAVDVRIENKAISVKGVLISSIQTDYPTTLAYTTLKERDVKREQLLSTRLREAVEALPTIDAIFLSEGRDFLSNIQLLPDAERATLFSSFAYSGAILVDTTKRKEGKGIPETLQTFDVKTGQWLTGMQKVVQMPWYEFLPPTDGVFLQRIGFSNLVASSTSRYPQYATTNNGGSLIEKGGVSMGVLLCADAFSPTRAAALAHKGADIIVVMSARACVNDSATALATQLDMMERVNAVFSGTPHLLISNQSLPVMIEPRWQK